MLNQWLVLLGSFAFVLAILALAIIASRQFKLKQEYSRKLIHILVGNWILYAFAFFKDIRFLLLTPLLFIIANYVSYRFKVVKVMERGENDQSMGTVWYAVSLFILSMLAFILKTPLIAISGILVMAYGDGLSAVVGKKWGKVHWDSPFSSKTYLGSMTMFFVSFVVMAVANSVYEGHLNLAQILLISLIAMLVELVASDGFDNVWVPLSVGFLVGFFTLEWIPSSFYLQMLIAALILGGGYYKKAITLAGLLNGLLVALIISKWGDASVFYALISFFIVGSLVSKVGKNKKIIEANLHHKTGARDSVQVYANAGGAVIMVLLGQFTQMTIFNRAALVIFIAALADTLSSEIGMLSKQEPVSIIGFKKVPTGISGGVTFLGLLAALVGSLVMSAVFIGPDSGIQEVILVALCGFIGSLIDSLMGATIQTKYYDHYQKQVTEKTKKGQEKFEKIGGLSFINNDWVNFLATVTTSFLYVGLKAFS